MSKGLIFTFVLTYGGAIASIFDPFIGLLVYVCFSILKPDALWHWVELPGNSSRTVAIALLVGWALKGFGRWDLGRGKLMVWSFVVFFAWCCLAAVQAPNQ